MITGELKNKVDKIWEIFWTGGLANPLDVIEQLTYLMFVRDLDQIDQTRQRESLMLSIFLIKVYFRVKNSLNGQYLFINPLKTCTKSCRQKCFLLSSN